MIKAAFINSEGEICHIVTPASDSTLTDGEVRGDYTVKLIPADSDSTEFLERKYWDNGFKDRPSRPGSYYKWSSKAWEVDILELDKQINSKVARLLLRTDHTQLPDWPGQAGLWAAYRAQLRAITRGNAKHIAEVAWPTPPS